MRRNLLLLLVVVLALVGIGLWFFFRQRDGKSKEEVVDVSIPTIVNGQLVLPKVATTEGNIQTTLNATARLGVNSANLIGIYDNQNQKLAALRIIGETTNVGTKVVTAISPYVRFLDPEGKMVGQKIGRLSDNFTLYDFLPGARSYYDVTIDNPPTADKLEIVLNVSSSSDSATFDDLKIASRSVEKKTATYQGSASDSAGQQIEYYTVTGQVVNTLTDPVSDISVYAWVKDTEGKVFSFGRQDFKNDLLSPRDKLDFKITLLPLKLDQKYDSFEVAAWGKRYRLNL